VTLFLTKSILFNLSILLGVLLLAVPSKADEVVLIVNTDVPVSSITRDEVKRIFLGKKTSLEDWKGEIVFAIQKKTDAAIQFLSEYVGKSTYQYNIYWKKRVFAGKGKAPPAFSSDQEIAAFVSKTAGAMGFVSAGTAVLNAKIIPVR
jgi:ABC-type phosphate transport system substrate-binding protein